MPDTNKAGAESATGLAVLDWFFIPFEEEARNLIFGSLFGVNWFQSTAPARALGAGGGGGAGWLAGGLVFGRWLTGGGLGCRHDLRLGQEG